MYFIIDESTTTEKATAEMLFGLNSNEYVSLAEFGATLALQRMGVSTAEAAENEVSNNEAKESASGSEADGDEKPEDGGEEEKQGQKKPGSCWR